MANEAVHASSFFQTFEKVKKNPDVQKAQGRSKIGQLADHEAWVEFVKVIDEDIAYLDSMRDIQIDDTPETVGMRVLASKIAISYLKKYKNLPELSKNVVVQLKKDE